MYRVNMFLDYLKFEKGNSERTIFAYRIDIEKFLKFSKKNVDEILAEDIFKYMQYLKEKFQYNTVVRKITAIKSMYKFLYTQKMVKKDPTNKIYNLKKEERLPEVLSLEEIKQIINSFNHNYEDRRNQLIVKLLFATGARISEILNLEIKDVENNEFKYIKVLGKGSKYRIIPIYDELEEEIKEYILNIRPNIKKSDQSFLLFPSIRRENFWKVLKKHAQNIGLKKNIYPHIFRHSVATIMLSNGADIRILQELLGHSSIKTTENYTHVEKSVLKDIYRNIKIGE